MPRRRQETPTEVELEILQVLWEQGPSTVREVADALNRKRSRAYTSILSMLNVMFEKGLVARKLQGRAHVYRATASRQRTLGRFVNDVLGRVFEGSATSLIAQVLAQSRPSPAELDKIQREIEAWQDKGQDKERDDG